jgi:hypothetical protein
MECARSDEEGREEEGGEIPHSLEIENGTENIRQPAELQGKDIMNEEVDKEKPGEEEGVEPPMANLAGLPKVIYQEVVEVMQDVGQVTKKKRGEPQKDRPPVGGEQREAISPGPSKGSVTDGGVGECVDPEGNGVTMGRWAGGPGLPIGDQDKQLFCNSGGGENPMGEPGGQQDGSHATSRTHHAQST